MAGGVEVSRVRVDSRGAPTHVSLVGADAEPEAVALAHANGLRCFALRGCAVLELCVESIVVVENRRWICPL